MYRHRYLAFIPAICILLFPVAYSLAALQYPGGTNTDACTQGYSLAHNFWCELLADTGKNGMPNPGMGIAMGGMVMLCFGLSVLWWLMPAILHLGERLKLLVQVCGIVSMLLAVFIFTPWHDAVINVAGSFGLLAMAGLLVSLYRGQKFLMLVGGALCALVVLANTYVYHSRHYIEILPVIQKVGFVIVLCWFLAVSVILYARLRNMASTTHPIG